MFGCTSLVLLEADILVTISDVFHQSSAAEAGAQTEIGIQLSILTITS